MNKIIILLWLFVLTLKVLNAKWIESLDNMRSSSIDRIPVSEVENSSHLQINYIHMQL